jgi:predicted ATPase
MITSLTIENFKCFSNLRLDLKPLTLLTGFNGGGKSTSMQSLLLLAQGLRGPPSDRGFALNGNLVRLGTAGDVLPGNAIEKIIRIKVEGPAGSIEWSLEAPAGYRMLPVRAGSYAGEDSQPHTWKESLYPDKRRIRMAVGLTKAIKELVFLSAVRGGVGDAFPFPNLTGLVHADVGIEGEYAAYWYDRHVDDEVDVALRQTKEPAGSLRKQLDANLGSLFPGAQVNVTAFPQASMLNVQFRLSETGDWRRPANIGYGLAYSFPVLVSLFTTRVGQLIVIDSPEAHLHPSAQSQMGRILANFAAAGRRILVETHSDHLLNGVRLAVIENKIHHDKVAVHFFSGGTRAEGFNVVSPRLDANGKFDFWPKGFFDQSEEDLMRLAGWA